MMIELSFNDEQKCNGSRNRTAEIGAFDRQMIEGGSNNVIH